MATTNPITTGELVDTVWLNQVTLARYRNVSTVTVANSVAATDLIPSMQVEAGALSTNRGIRVTAWGDMKNNSGSTRAAPVFIVQWHDSIVLQTPAIASFWPTNTARAPWRATLEFLNLNSSGTQWASFEMDIAGGAWTAATSAALTTGEGRTASNSDGSMVKILGGVLTGFDTALLPTHIQLQVQLPVADANVDTVCRGAVAEII